MTTIDTWGSLKQSVETYFEEFPQEWKAQALYSFSSSTLISLAYRDVNSALTFGILSAICSIAFAALSPFISKLYASDDGLHSWPQTALRVNLALFVTVSVSTLTNCPLSPLSVLTMMAFHTIVREQNPSKSASFFLWN